MQNQTIFELHTDDSKSKYSSNPKDIIYSAKKKKKKRKERKTLHQANFHSCYY